MIVRKTSAELDKMARAGRVVADVLEALVRLALPGATTLELDAFAEEKIRARGATPSFKGYRGFPATLCTSPNAGVVHGIPSVATVLSEGDVLSIDCGAIVDGYHADSAITVIVGGDAAAPEPVRALVEDTRSALWQGLAQVRSGRALGDIGAAIEQVAVAGGYGLVREYVGHGIGRALHEDPSVPNYGTAGCGARVADGWVVAVEPMFNLGGAATRRLADGWGVVTVDGSPSAHWEHTVAVTPDGPRVLTARSDEPVDPAQWARAQVAKR
ncbi:MAG: type I methionyl aminopeptidase [Actinobacteria bacterium]|nr:type I methionyl aminopeptidase [Actinomycetota bacterium]